MLTSTFARFHQGSAPAIAAWWTAVGGVIGLFLLMLPTLSGYMPPLVLAGIGAIIGLLVGLSNVTSELRQYRDEREGREGERKGWLTIAEQLGEFGIEGKTLIPKERGIPAPWHEVNQWKENVGAYIESKLGKGHRFLFESGAGNEPKVPKKILSADDRERWIHVQARLMTLKQLVWRCIENADRLPRRPEPYRS